MMKMALIFEPKEHKYVSVDSENPINWQSVTSVIAKFKKPFDADSIALKSSKNKKSKWYGMTPEQIKEAWKAESDRAMKLGTWYHTQRESDLLECEFIERDGFKLSIVKPLEVSGVKHAPEQKLIDGIYPEHLVYLKSAGMCGQADRIEVVNGIVNVYDYKTNKEIKKESFKNWEGIPDTMLDPINHIQDSNYWHYALQLSFYMYMVIKHNPKLKPGKLYLDHVIFEEDGIDDKGYKIHKLDLEGHPIIKDVVRHDLPYLKSEVISIINHIKFNEPA